MHTPSSYPPKGQSKYIIFHLKTTIILQFSLAIWPKLHPSANHSPPASDPSPANHSTCPSCLLHWSHCFFIQLSSASHPNEDVHFTSWAALLISTNVLASYMWSSQELDIILQLDLIYQHISWPTLKTWLKISNSLGVIPDGKMLVNVGRACCSGSLLYLNRG